MSSKQNINHPIHNEQIKKKYSHIERTIKGRLGELFLLAKMGDNASMRGLSITKDFQIRELFPEENDKNLANIATIKNPTLYTSRTKVQEELFKLIDKNIEEKEIQTAYKKGILDFFSKLKTYEFGRLRNAGKLYRAYIKPYVKTYYEEKDVDIFNIRSQMGKILFSKFGDDAFFIQKNPETGFEKVILSPKSLNYIKSLFYNANQVWKERGKNVDQVFHDGDFPFILDNLDASEEDYMEVFHYLIDRNKHNPHGKRGELGNAEWANKTSQYIDILWALTNEQLKIHELPNLQNQPEFQRDDTIKSLFTIGGGDLEKIIDAYNIYDRGDKNKFVLSKRLKSLPSCVEKTIEGKYINDAIGFRLTTSGISNEHFSDVVSISKERFKALSTSLITHPEKYVKSDQTIQIKSITIDNKNVLTKKQLKDMEEELSSLNLPLTQREKTPSPYVSVTEREDAMKRNYQDDYKDPQRRSTISAFFDQFAGNTKRGVNGSYKDFKFNLVFEVKDKKTDQTISEKTMEVQFDDINNGKGMANYNIRNCERSVNTQSRLSFDVPLTQVRKIIETNLKKMQHWAKDKDPSFSILDLEDGGPTVDITTFNKRSQRNSANIDQTIIRIINYFIRKGTFLLYIKQDGSRQKPNLENGLLTIKNLDSAEIGDVNICTNLEVATQQHAYFQNKRNGEVGIYIPDQKVMGRVSLGELIDRINLGKKKKSEYSEQV